MAERIRDDGLSATGVFCAAMDLMVQQAVRERVEEMSGALRREREQLRRSVDERLQRLEARISSLEARVTSLHAMEGSEAAGGQGALEQLEARMRALEEGLQRALTKVFPRVEDLVARLETPSALAPVATAAPLAAEGERGQVAQMYNASAGEELCMAASGGNLDTVRRLLASGANVNYNCRGESPLLSAFSAKVNPDIVSLLVGRGADVNATNPLGQSALHCAATLGRCVSLLINAGAVVDARDRFGRTPLQCAALQGKVEAVRALLSAGADTRHMPLNMRQSLKRYLEEPDSAADFVMSYVMKTLRHQ